MLLGDTLSITATLQEVSRTKKSNGARKTKESKQSLEACLYPFLKNHAEQKRAQHRQGTKKTFTLEASRGNSSMRIFALGTAMD